MLQWVQNIAGRLVLDKEQVESTTECLKILHWLPIGAKILVQSYYVVTQIHCKVKHLGYLTNMFAVNPIPNRCLRSSSRPNRRIVSFTRCKTFADRSLSVESPRLWNSLPDDMRSLQDTDQFKARLETLLFNTLNSAYNKVAFNENSVITKENFHTKYTYSPINTSALMKSHL